MIRAIDIFLSIVGLIFFLPIFPFIFLAAHIETGSGIFSQFRVGQNQKPFLIYKFRSMQIKTPAKATHLISEKNITKFGNFLRKSKLDEILQLYNVLLGNMSLVGPRPCLLSQKKLIIERKKRGVFRAKPGITGLAQLRGITMKNATLLAKIDSKMIKSINISNYSYYVFMTLFSIFKKNYK
jgi:O-antigen biosynthesis protein WbqP